MSYTSTPVLDIRDQDARRHSGTVGGLFYTFRLNLLTQNALTTYVKHRGGLAVATQSTARATCHLGLMFVNVCPAVRSSMAFYACG